MKQDMIEDLKNQYHSIPIPRDLDAITWQAIRQSHTAPEKRKRRFIKPVAIAASALAALVLVFNLFPEPAYALKDVPVIGSIVQVITFGRFQASDEKRAYDVDIEVPKITGLANEQLQNGLNAEYLAQSKALYREFMQKINPKDDTPVHAAVVAGYEVKAQSGNLISIMRYVDKTQASCEETQQFVTIDTEKQTLLTLPGLFKDKSYVDIISKNILAQMKAGMAADKDTQYDIGKDGFTKIAENQQFYINADHKLVIVFDKYTVAPGYMGVVEFVIPTDVLSPILAGSEYIK